MADTDLIYGLHAVRHALTDSPEKVLELWVAREGKKPRDIVQTAEQAGITCQWVPKKTLDKMSEGQRHQGVIVRQKASKAQDEHDLMQIIKNADTPVLLLILDSVQDPHNLGACLRTADAAGVNAVIIPASRGVGITPTVRKVACGATESVALIVVKNLARTLAELQEAGVWLIGTSDQAENTLHDVDMTGAVGLVMGAEDVGIRRLTKEHCDHLVQIPMAGVVESLNVSVATGVCLYEAVRQRR